MNGHVEMKTMGRESLQQDHPPSIDGAHASLMQDWKEATDLPNDTERRSNNSRHDFARRLLFGHPIVVAIAALFFIVLMITPFGYHHFHSGPSVREPSWSKSAASPPLPRGTLVVGLIFYGRPEFVTLLDCYLRRNLKRNGGMLDEVRFVMHTPSDKDTEWLEHHVQEHKLQDDYKLLYEDRDLTGGTWAGGGSFSYLWGRYATDPNTIYLKIDDDVVWIDDNAIKYMVHSLLEHPEAYSVQANTINSRFTHWFHYTTGAVRPFLPDPNQALLESATEPPEPFEPLPAPPVPPITKWRISSLPDYPPELVPEYNHTKYKLRAHKNVQDGQRWLPLPNTPDMLLHTSFGNGTTLPIAQTSEMLPPRYWTAAQEHMSLLYHLEHKSLDSYIFGRSDGLWNTWFQHYSINFLAFWGHTVAARPFWNQHDNTTYVENDEIAVTMTVPEELTMPVYIQTHALVSHYAFHSLHQRTDLMRTDIYDRYRLMANELYCSKSNQKDPI